MAMVYCYIRRGSSSNIRAVLFPFISILIVSRLYFALGAQTAACWSQLSQRFYKMALDLPILSFFILFNYASVLPRADPPFQSVPAETTTPDNQFNAGMTIFKGQPADTSAAVPAVYGPRSIWTIFPNSQFPIPNSQA